MGEHDDHRKRVYDRALQDGLDGMPPHNVMELLLFYCQPRGDTNALAHRLIDAFGSVAQVLDAPIEELQRVRGVGETVAKKLKLLVPLCRAYEISRVEGNNCVDSVQRSLQYCRPLFFGKTDETAYVLSLDDKRRVVHTACLSQGSANVTSIDAAGVVAEAVRYHATGIIVAHNHPRGLAVPSAEDIRATMEIFKALSPVHVALVDHLIFTDDAALSMANEGYLQRIEEQYRSRPFSVL